MQGTTLYGARDVRVEDDIYVRAHKGRTSPWFRGAETCHRGQIHAGSVEKDVAFVEETNTAINDRIDSAYLTKYRRYPTYVAPLVTEQARAATITCQLKKMPDRRTPWNTLAQKKSRPSVSAARRSEMQHTEATNGSTGP